MTRFTVENGGAGRPVPGPAPREARELLTQREIADRVRLDVSTLRRIPFFRRIALDTTGRACDRRWPDWAIAEYARLLEIGAAEARPIKRTTNPRVWRAG